MSRRGRHILKTGGYIASRPAKDKGTSSKVPRDKPEEESDADAIYDALVAYFIRMVSALLLRLRL